MAKKSQQERIEELTEQMNNNIMAYKNDPEEEIKLLKYLRKFRQYSVRNTSLIQGQYEGAMGVASYKQHQEKGYQVQKGEKAIRILAPRLQEVFRDENNKQKFVSRATKAEKLKIRNKEIQTKKVLVGYVSVPVFDIRQTDCPEADYPKLYPNKPENFEFNGSQNDFSSFKKAVYEFADETGVSVGRGKLDSVAKGYYVPSTNEIMLRDDLSEQEEAKVLLHELAHAKMHNLDNMKLKDQEHLSTDVIEYQAEMTAYIVSSTFELDSEDYSQRYLANWTKKDIENETYIKSLEEVKDVSNSMIEEISEKYNVIKQQQEQETTKEKNEIKQELSDEEVAEKIGFFRDKKNNNHFPEMKTKIFKATKIATESKDKYESHIIRLESKDEDVFTERIITPKTTKNDLEKWQKGMTGNEWLDENLKSELPRKKPNSRPAQEFLDNEYYEDKLNDMKEHIKEKNIEVTPTR